MPALFGFFDPDAQLPADALRQMADVLRQPGEIAPLLELRGQHWQSAKIAYPGEAAFGQDFLVNGVAAFIHPAQDFKTFFAAVKQGRGGDVALRGSFCAVIVEAEDTLSLVSDRYGTQPLYIYQAGSLLLFATQVKAIAALLGTARKINLDAVNAMLSFGEVLGNETLLAGVETLPAGSVLRIGPNGVQKSRYWQYTYEENTKLDWSQAVEQSGRLLKAAIDESAAFSCRPAVPLSGGLDSRFALDLLVQQKRDVKTYTWGVEDCRDLEFGGQIACALGVSHESYHFDPAYLSTLAERGVWLTEGHTPATNFHVLPYVDMLVQRQHDLILDGFAGDAVLGGNFITGPWQYGSDYKNSADALWFWRSQGFDGAWSATHASAAHELTKSRFMSLYQETAGKTAMDKAMAFLLDNRVRRITTCGTEIFRSSIPVYQPFMDAAFMDFIRTLPHGWRKRHRFYLDVLKTFGPRSSSAPYQRTLLPASAPYWQNWLSLATQRGLGMVGLGALLKGKSPSDFPAWFRGPLAMFVDNLLCSERTLDRGVMPADLVRSAVSEHRQGTHNLAGTLGAMISVELFCRLFIDDLSGSASRLGAPGMAQREAA